MSRVLLEAQRPVQRRRRAGHGRHERTGRLNCRGSAWGRPQRPPPSSAPPSFLRRHKRDSRAWWAPRARAAHPATFENAEVRCRLAPQRHHASATELFCLQGNTVSSNRKRAGTPDDSRPARLSPPPSDRLQSPFGGPFEGLTLLPSVAFPPRWSLGNYRRRAFCFAPRAGRCAVEKESLTFALKPRRLSGCVPQTPGGSPLKAVFLGIAQS